MYTMVSVPELGNGLIFQTDQAANNHWFSI